MGRVVAVRRPGGTPRAGGSTMAGAGTSATSTGITTTMRTTHCATCAPTTPSRSRTGRWSATKTYGTGKVIHSDGNLGWQDRCYYYNQYSAQVQPNPERGLHGFTCTKMGISSGCSDEYAASLDCQWIDITDAPDGDYWLTVATNWDEAGREETSPENDYTNNEANVAIQIQGHTVTILSSAQVHQQCPNDSAGARAVAKGYHDDEPEMMTGSRIRAESFPEPGL